MIVGKIKSKYILNELRFSGGYFLNEDAVNSRLLEENADKCIPLKELAQVFNPPIFKRQFCENTERAVPYCQSSDVTNALEGSDVFINKSQAIKVGAVVKDKQILVTGFGTIGNTRLVNKLSDGIAYANNVCRIESHDESNYGYIYALMTSKYGRAQLNKNASGSVVRYIEAPGIKETLVPILPKHKQQQIHNLIVESSKLRVEANRMLNVAVELVNTGFKTKLNSKSQTGRTSIRDLNNNYQKRLNSPTYIYPGVSTIKKLKEDGFTFKLLDSLNFKARRPGIFKRIKVNGTNGLPYLKGSELNKMNPFNSCEYLSKTKTPFLEELKLRENQILLTCAGTIGDVKLISKEFEEKSAIGSQDIIRIEEDSSYLSIYYLFAYLKSDIIQNYIQSLKYGSVIERVEPFHIDMIPVYIPEKEVMNNITVNVENYKNLFYKAFKMEEEAINLIEKEIESWQES